MRRKAPPKQARLLTSVPLTPKNKAASEAMDAWIATKPVTLETIARRDWTEHLVRLYQLDPGFSRESLARHNKDDEFYELLPDLGASVRARLLQLGLIKENP